MGIRSWVMMTSVECGAGKNNFGLFFQKDFGLCVSILGFAGVHRPEIKK
jgi:hypothetical protein